MANDLSLKQQQLIYARQSKWPVDVQQLAADLDATVSYVPLEEHISGYIQWHNEQEGYTIAINKEHSEHRQRFTCAHEIAHILLHAHVIKQVNTIQDNKLYRSDHIANADEVQANKLAADILLPYHLLDRATNSITSVRGLAKAFNVSHAEMSLRLNIPYID